ncbi:Aspartic protease PEP1 [Daldinia childiae]|uniref:Aspartic protease PEP1 n=1 Tax=Daldinia childiae TaxID=326645 RepID=UPI0014465E4D|nr:Aspartic protease PEP1 [Daldinia childiae]KAF3071030.1 Aspartic protease PEP1 [Daldinia childiae]
MAYFPSVRVVVMLCLSFFTTTVWTLALVPKTGKTLSLPLSHNADVPRHGPTDYLKTLKKYNLNVPEGLQQVVDAHKAATNNKIVAGEPGSSAPAAAHDGDLLWLTPVSIGDPPQQLYLDLDTGSSDTWIFSTDTDKTEVAGQTLWDPSKSSSANKIQNCTWSIIYGDFSTSQGICYKDTLILGNLSIPNMTIESATSVSTMFTESANMSGLVGLAWPSIAQMLPPQKTLLDLLPNVLSQPLFTVDLRHNSSEGSFNFGYIDDSLHTSDIKYIDVNTTDGYWAVQQTGFSIGGSDVKYEFSEARDIIVDTGSTLFFAPEEAVKTYFGSVPGANYSYTDYGWVLPCNTTPPDFVYELGDTQGNRLAGSVPGAYFVYAHSTDELCYAGLQSLSSFTDMPSIFGDVFLKSGFAVFDIANKKFGMAPKPVNTNNDKRDLDARDEVKNVVEHI